MAMKPGMKMMLMDKMRPENNRSEYGGGNRRMIGYDRDMYGGMGQPENRSRGRYMEGGWENTHYPMYGGNGGYPTENRRRRDRRGRYMINDPNMMDDDYDEDEPRSYQPQMHGGIKYGFGDVYAEIHAPGSMNRPMGGMMGGSMKQPVDEHTARMWVNGMDGGEHFKMEQCEQQRMAICPDCDKWEFYVAMNAMYSDYHETAKKLGIDRLDYYAHMAKDFLKDKDAKPHKLRRYMETIAK